MKTIEEFSTSIRRVLETHPAYTITALSLGFSIYRWNANRVRDMLRRLQLQHAEESV